MCGNKSNKIFKSYVLTTECECLYSRSGLCDQLADLSGPAVGGDQSGHHPHLPCTHPGGNPQNHRSVLSTITLILTS